VGKNQGVCRALPRSLNRCAYWENTEDYAAFC